jgi:hypothetical protein
MTAARSIPASAQERCARRTLVNGLDRSGGTSAAAEMQPGEPGTTLLCRDDLLRGLKERTMAAWKRYLGNPGLNRRDAITLAQTLRAGQLTAVWIPDEPHVAMRDLMRLWAIAKRVHSGGALGV